MPVSCTISSPGQVKNKVSVLPPLQGLLSAPEPPSSHPLPGPGRMLQHSPAPGTLAVKMQLSDRRKGRQTDNNLSDNKRKKPTKLTNTMEKIQTATKHQGQGKADILPRLSGASAKGRRMGLSLSLGITTAVGPVFQRQDLA